MINLSFILSLSLLLSSYDYRISTLTISEIINIFLFLVFYLKDSNNKINLIILLIILIIFYLFNGFVDALSGGHRQLELLGFLFKYINIFVTIYLFNKIKIDVRVCGNISILILTFWALWVTQDVTKNPTSALFYGIAFPRPQTEDLISADSHLFGFLVGIVGIFAIISRRKFISKLLVFVITVGLIISIGARTPVALFIAGSLFTMILETVLKRNLKLLLSLMSAIAVGFIALTYVKLNNVGDIYRSLSFKIDGSIIGRFKKLDIVLNNASETFPYGIGFSRLSFIGRWVDGLIATLILDFGLYLGLFLVLIIITFSLKFCIILLKDGKYFSCVAFMYIVGAQFITEYLLTGRGSILSIGFFYAVLAYESERNAANER